MQFKKEEKEWTEKAKKETSEDLNKAEECSSTDYENDLEYFINVDLTKTVPKSADVKTIPELCHTEGIWARFLDDDDAQEMRKDLHNTMHSRMTTILPKMPSYADLFLSYSTADQFLGIVFFMNGTSF